MTQNKNSHTLYYFVVKFRLVLAIVLNNHVTNRKIQAYQNMYIKYFVGTYFYVYPNAPDAPTPLT